MPGTPDYRVEIVDGDGEPDMSVAIVGDQVVDLEGASDGDVVTVQADGTLAPEAPSGGGGAPSGPAGGVLGGTYPDPTFAEDMATQAELNAHLTDTSDAHDASAVSFSDSGLAVITGVSDVQAALALVDAALDAGPAAETWIRALKTSNQAVASSTTLVNATQLVAALEADSTYDFWATILVDTGTSEDIKLAFTVPASAVLRWSGVGPALGVSGAEGTARFGLGDTSGTAIPFGGAGSGTPVPVMIKGDVSVAGTSGNLQLQFAQNTSGGTNTNILNRSVLLVRKAS